MWISTCVRKMERKVWSEHQYTKKDGRILNFTVLDCPENRFNDAMDLYKKYYMKDGTVKKLTGISQNKEATEEYTKILTKQLKAEGAHITVCIENSTDTMVGVSAMILSKSSYSHLIPDVRTKEVAKQLEILDILAKSYIIPKSYSVDKYYDDFGIAVHTDYRGIGIGSALLQSRKNICRYHGVPVTCAWATSITAQKFCERDGWETVLELDSEEFVRKLELTPFDGMPLTFKLFVKRVL